MLHYQRQRISEDPHRYYHLDKVGYSEPSPRRSSIVDISNLIESRRPLSSEGKRTLIGSQSSNAHISFIPPIVLGPNEPGGGPVRSPRQLPPVSSIQLQPPPPPPPILSQHAPQQSTYAPAPPVYYASPPAVPALPPYQQQSLPSIAAAAHSTYGPPPPPPELPNQANTGTKRSAEEFPRSSSPPPSKKHHGKWTEEEDNLAIELRRRGMKWDDIAKRIPGRSAISCRLRYQNYSEKRPNWDEEKKNKLARLYNRFKRDMWEMVATEMGLPWRAVEAMHWQMGQEEMASRANVPVFQPHASGSSGAGFDEDGRVGSPPPSSVTFSERYGPAASDAPAQGLRARRSSSVGSRRAASMAMERPSGIHMSLPSLTEPVEYTPLGRPSHAHTQSQPQNVHERRYSTLPPLAPLSDPGRPDAAKGNTYPTPSTAQSHLYSYPSSSSTAQASMPGLTAAGSPSTYQPSEAYGTPSPRTFYGRSTEERSTLGNGTPIHNRQASQGSVRSTRSLAYGSLTAGVPVTNGSQWGHRYEESGSSAPNSASVGRRMSIPGVRRNSIALPPPK